MTPWVAWKTLLRCRQADTAQSYTYTKNNLNQRTRVTREDGSYWSYIYNDRGELVSGKKYWWDNSKVWGAQNEYNFDNIGNRKDARTAAINWAASDSQTTRPIHSINTPNAPCPEQLM